MSGASLESQQRKQMSGDKTQLKAEYQKLSEQLTEILVQT